MPAGAHDEQNNTGHVEDEPELEDLADDETEGLVPCQHCGDVFCDGHVSICPKHPDRVAAREGKIEWENRWEYEFQRGYDAHKYGEEVYDRP
jgi:hypothetical protein